MNRTHGNKKNRGKREHPKNNTYLEYSAMENGGKFQFMIWKRGAHFWALFHHLFLLLDFKFLDFYGDER
jgi:hypothetical protein